MAKNRPLYPIKGIPNPAYKPRQDEPDDPATSAAAATHVVPLHVRLNRVRAMRAAEHEPLMQGQLDKLIAKLEAELDASS